MWFDTIEQNIMSLYSSYQVVLKRTEANLKERDDTLARMATENNQVWITNSTLQEEIERMNSLLSETKCVIQIKDSELSTLITNCNAIELQYDQVNAENHGYKSKIHLLEDELLVSQTENNELSQKLANKSQIIETLEIDLLNRDKFVGKLQLQLDDKESVVASLTIQLDELQSDYLQRTSRFKEELLEKIEQIGQLNESLKISKIQNEGLERDLGNLNLKISHFNLEVCAQIQNNNAFVNELVSNISKKEKCIFGMIQSVINIRTYKEKESNAYLNTIKDLNTKIKLSKVESRHILSEINRNAI